ncbi:MAG: GNAT family N-acetyltransferase [Defluviitaleaceae bacterium]|nr:GNAT family N-acetyltransferase [Defluviitaleaceae bacterium]
MEIKIRSYLDSDYAGFKEMLTTCFHQDYDEQLTEEQLDRWQNALVRRATAEIVFLDILIIDDVAKGFILYQIDSPESDWCIKEGYGTIRELYVVKDLRHAGYGRALTIHAESRLNLKNIKGLYLTSEDEAIGFWIKMGYKDSGEICSENDSPIFVKYSSIT